MTPRTKTYSAIIHKNSRRAFRRGECGMTHKGFQDSYSAQLVVDVLGKPLKTLPHPSTRVTSKYAPHVGKKHAAKLEARAIRDLAAKTRSEELRAFRNRLSLTK